MEDANPWWAKMATTGSSKKVGSSVDFRRGQAGPSLDPDRTQPAAHDVFALHARMDGVELSLKQITSLLKR